MDLELPRGRTLKPISRFVVTFFYVARYSVPGSSSGSTRRETSPGPILREYSKLRNRLRRTVVPGTVLLETEFHWDMVNKGTTLSVILVRKSHQLYYARPFGPMALRSISPWTLNPLSLINAYVCCTRYVTVGP